MNDFTTIETIACTYEDQDRYQAPVSIAYVKLMDYPIEDRDPSQREGILRILSHRKVCGIHDENFHREFADLMSSEFSESQVEQLKRNLEYVIANNL